MNINLEDYEYPLSHSVNWEDTKLILTKPTVYSFTTNYIYTDDSVIIRELEGDCGCLLINNLYKITPETLTKILEFASQSGYSKIIGTLSTEYKIETTLETLKTFKFKIIYTGKSNRSDSYNNQSLPAKTYLVYKVIKPLTKGYCE